MVCVAGVLNVACGRVWINRCAAEVTDKGVLARCGKPGALMKYRGFRWTCRLSGCGRHGLLSPVMRDSRDAFAMMTRRYLWGLLAFLAPKPVPEKH